MDRPLYQRVLLKLSGEALMGSQTFGVERGACERIAQAIKDVYLLGLEIGIVVGGGNIFRGSQAEEFGFSRTPADHIGMIATTINGLILQQSMAALGIESRVMSALDNAVVEKYVWGQAMHYLQKKIIVIFVGGSGNPYFTTDTAAALRACEVQAQLLLKATKVNGVYSEDPKKNSKATKYSTLTYTEALVKQLHVMDASAIALCRENSIPIYVCDLFEEGSLKQALCLHQGGTLVTGE
ncbi:MAG: UMP kinase [Chlamydiae bacterium]|nr:UMP kinase [Chlamydiota bacterium]